MSVLEVGCPAEKGKGMPSTWERIVSLPDTRRGLPGGPEVQVSFVIAIRGLKGSQASQDIRVDKSEG